MRFWKRNLALLAALVMGLAGAAWAWRVTEQERQVQREIAGQVIRFHVLANSDRRADQEIKNQVKERLLYSMEELLAYTDDLEETRACLTSALPQLQEEAQETVREAGSGDIVTVELTTAETPSSRGRANSRPVKNWLDTLPGSTYSPGVRIPRTVRTPSFCS